LEQALTSDLKITAAFDYSKTVHASRFVDRNDAVFGSPWSLGLGADKTNGIGQLTTLESSSKALYRGLTIGMQKQFSRTVAIDQLRVHLRLASRLAAAQKDSKNLHLLSDPDIDKKVLIEGGPSVVIPTGDQ